jgi:ribosome-binding protein aMBF1 (putative translation factor)
MPKTTDALQILKHRLGESPKLDQMIAREKLNVHVARMIYLARTEAGLTQQELARLVGTKQQVIARLEDADYEGHSLSMLRRIAEALGRTLEIRFAQHQHAR